MLIFIFSKDNKTLYVQAAYSVAEDKAYNREFSAFYGIPQTDKKLIITNDDVDFSTSNITHISFKDFLRMETLE